MGEVSNCSEEIDAVTVTNTVKAYFENYNPQLGFLLFRIESVDPNDKPGVWIVKCSFKASFGSTKRLYYELHVSNNGKISEVQKINEDES